MPVSQAPVDRALSGLLTLGVIAVGPVTTFANKGTTVLISALFLVLLGLKLRAGAAAPFMRPPKAVWLPLTLFTAWAGLSTLWAVDPEHTMAQTAKFAAMSVLGLAVIGLGTAWRDARPAVSDWPTVFAAAAALHLACVFIGQFLTDLDAERGGATLAFMIWPAMAICRRKGGAHDVLALGLVAASGVFMLFTPMSAALLAFAVGLCVYVSALWRPRLAAGALFAGLAAALIATPWVFHAVFEEDVVRARIEEGSGMIGSFEHRLIMWIYTSGRVSDKPVAGWGFDAARAMPGSKTPIAYIKRRGNWYISLHPHNAPIQIWLETGAVGALIFLSLLAGLGARVWRRLSGWTREEAGARLASVAAFAIVAMLSFGAWQSWWVACAWLLAFYWLPVEHRPTGAKRGSIRRCVKRRT